MQNLKKKAQKITSGLMLFALVFGLGAFTVPQVKAAGVNDFVIRVKTDNLNPGSSGDNKFTINTSPNGMSYNYNVDCDNNGTIEFFNQNNDVTCEYPAPGEYNIAISGSFPTIYSIANEDEDKILSINQWGTGTWASLRNSFFGAQNLDIVAADAPIFGLASSLHWAFAGASSFTGLTTDMSEWDTTNITSLWNTFGSTPFNGNIGGWNTANVTNMGSTFHNNPNFNQDISEWETGKVTTMEAMFYNASSFNQNLGSWDVSKVTDMSNMFTGTALSRENYDSILMGWSVQAVQPNVVLDVDNVEYCASAAHDILTSAPNNWIINDGGLSTSCDPNEVSIDISQTTLTEGDVTTFTFTTARPAMGDITISYRFKSGVGTDPSADLFTFNESANFSGTIVIPNGESSVTAFLIPTDDDIAENDEELQFIITSVESPSDPEGAYVDGDALLHSLVINDDDSNIRVSFPQSQSVIDEDMSTAYVAVWLSGPAPAEGVSFTVGAPFNMTSTPGMATLGVDFSLPTTTITIPENESAAVIEVSINNDSFYEGDEGLFLILSNPENATLVANPYHTLTINDNDLLTVSFAAATSTESEDVTTRTVQLVLSGPASQDVTVAIEAALAQSTAVPLVDWAFSVANVTIPAGQTTANAEITVVNDSIQESDETASIQIKAIVGATAGPTTTHTFIIAANDVPANTGGGNSGGNGGGSSSGGGSGIAIPAPILTNPGFSTENFGVRVDSLTTVGDLTFANLVLTGGTATGMSISNNAAFENAVQVPYRTSTMWKLPSGNGTKTVYAKFFNNAGTASAVVSTTVTVSGQEEGGEVLGEQISLLDELVARLKYGTTSDEVRQLQTLLQQKGYFVRTFRPTRLYGPMTRTAVARYVADKKMASMTLDQMVRTLKFGTRSSMVARMQTELKKGGYFPANVAVTNYYGVVTRGAVEKFRAFEN